MKAIEKMLERMINESLGEVVSEERKPEFRDYGCAIVVLDRGWVYVGNVTVTGDWLEITDSKNIRRWGTSSGLGQLLSGPLPETKSDPSGNVVCPIKSVISIMPCKPNHNW
jgi:hypothetical protein